MKREKVAMKHVPVYLRMLCLLAIAGGFLLATVAVAAAGPSGPTMGLTELDSRLSTAPVDGLDGYFKTVMRGSDITTIPCKVMATTGAEDQSSSLILFEANAGSAADKVGGIVEGMSGSPLYVTVDGTDYLIGAVSYGDILTLHNAGLATPIDFMSALESYPLGGPLSLSKTLPVGGKLVDQVVVTTGDNAPTGISGRTIVAKPLSAMMIGGIKPQSKMYKHLASALASRGVDVVPLATALSGGTAMQGGVPFSTDFAGGSTLVALASRGDLWFGALGTTTYENGSTVVGFGHPMFYTGPAHLYLMNGWVDGVWPSAYAPYKLGRPGALRGTIKQDRNAGILGKTDDFLAECTITANASIPAVGRSASSAVYMPQDLVLDWNIGGPFVVSAGTYVAASRAFDTAWSAGSAEITTTVVVENAGTAYTVTIPDMVDDSSDVAYAASMDAENAMWSLSEILDYGLENPKVLSVNLDATFSPTRKNADIVGLDAPLGLKAGADNLVRVSFLAYGVADTQTIDCTVTIPPKTPVALGMLEAFSTESGGGGMSDYGAGAYSRKLSAAAALPVSGSGASATSAERRPTVADVVDGLQSIQPANLLTVRFTPRSVVPTSFETTTLAPWVLYDSQTRYVPAISERAYPSAVAWDGSSRVYGTVYGPFETTPLSFWGLRAGDVAESLLGTGSAVINWDAYDPMPIYSKTIKHFRKNTRVRVHMDATDTWLSADATVNVGAYARIVLQPSSSVITRGKTITLKASVAPTETAGGTMTFQYYHLGWRTIGAATLGYTPGAAYAVATRAWKPPVGVNKIRAIYGGGVTNLKTTSGTGAVTVK